MGEEEAGSDKQNVATAGIHIMLRALVDSVCDKDELVRSIAIESIIALGGRHPDIVLNLLVEYLLCNNKMTSTQRTAILQAASRTCRNAVENDVELSSECLDKLIPVCADEVVSVPVAHANQGSASDALVFLSKKYCNKVMECLMQHINPSMVPHIYLIHTLSGIAAANVFQFVLYLKAIISVSLPIVSSLKSDELKIAYGNAICKFSESLLEYVGNMDKAPDKTVKAEMFSMEFDVVYDTLFNSWLASKVAKVRTAVLEALCFVTHLMSKEKAEQQIPKLIPVIMSLYRKHPDPYPVTKALSHVLKTSPDGKNYTFNLDSLLNCLFQQGFFEPDYAHPNSVKNYHEVLLCFDILGYHTDIAGNKSDQGLSVVSFLLEKLESSSLESRVVALVILRHLVNSRSVNCLRGREKIVLNSLQILLHDKDLKVKKVLAQMIVAMAHHGYLNSDGGYVFIEFILKQCTTTEDMTKRSSDSVSARESLRLMCGNILHLLATTVECAQPLLWPKMLRHLMQEEYVTAVPVLVKALAPLAQKHTENLYNMENKVLFASGEGLPLPVSIVARCIVLLVQQRDLGFDLLKLMSALAPFLNKSLVKVWEEKIVCLKSILEDCDEVKKDWNEELLNLLSVTLQTPESEEWILGIGGAFSAQIPLYRKPSAERGFLFRCLGMVAQHVTALEHVHPILDSILATVRHSEKTEREGAAGGIGICAVTHLDLVLIKLEALSKTAAGQTSRGLSSILAFMKQDSRSEADLCRIRALVLLCYGEVFVRCPINLLVTRLDTMLLNLLPSLHSAQDGVIREASLICMIKLATSLLRDGSCDAIATYREDFIALCQIHMKTVGTDALAVRLLAARTALNMIRLQPSVKPNIRYHLITTLFDAVFEVCKEVEEMSQENLELTDCMNDITIVLLKGSMVPSTADEMFTLLLPWLSSSLERSRIIAIQCLENILQCYLSKMTFNIGTPTSFAPLPIIVGNLSGRCTDPDVTVVKHAINCMKVAIQIGLRYEGYSQDFCDEALQPLLQLEGSSNDIVTCKISQVIIERVATVHLPSMLEALYCGVRDQHPSSSEGCAQLLVAILTNRGLELHQYVHTIIESIYSKLCVVKHDKTREYLLDGVQLIASHHLNVVITTLLGFPLPYDENLSAMWNILAKSACAPAILDLLIDLLLRERPYEDHKDWGNPVVRIAMIRPLTAICALREMFGASELQEAALKEFARLFSSLLLVQSSYVGVCSPISSPQGEKQSAHKFYPNRDAYKINPLWSTSECVMTLLSLCKCTNMSRAMSSLPVSHWQQVECYSLYANGLSPLIGAVPLDVCGLIDNLVECFTPSLNSVYESHRVTAVTVLGELINGPIGDSLDTVVTSLLSRHMDDCITVRKLSHRGLSYLSQKPCFAKYATMVLNCFLAGIDDRDDANGNVALEAFTALIACLPDTRKAIYSSLLVNIAIRIKPYLEKPQRELRAAAIQLVGVLASLAHQCDGELSSVRESVEEQAYSNFICLVMHMNDPEQMVVKASCLSLPKLCSLLNSKRVSSVLENNKQEGLRSFSQYVGDFANALIADMPEKINLYLEQTVSYFRSQWTDIQGAAALFSGALLGNLDMEEFREVSIEPVCTALSQLLRNSSSRDVRVDAASAMGQLSRF